MSTMLEALVTTLLSLDYLHQQPQPPLPKQHQHQPLEQVVPRVPSRCQSRSSSLSTTTESSSDSTSSSDATAEWNSSQSNSQQESSSTKRQPVYQYHCPPPISSIALASSDNKEDTSTTTDRYNYYDNNDTVFGAILRGDLPAVTLAETSQWLAIEDIKPRAPLHALVIPKAFVGSVFDLESSSNDKAAIQEMKQLAVHLVKAQFPEAYETGDYRLCFHIPPFNSVDHLHLHVLAPVSEMTWYYRSIKYNPTMRWCTGLEEVLDRLSRNLPSVPYRRPPTCKPQKEPMITSGGVEGQVDEKEVEKLCVANEMDSDEEQEQAKETC